MAGPDWGVSAMVDIPTLIRSKSLRKATDLSVSVESPDAPDSKIKMSPLPAKPTTVVKNFNTGSLTKKPFPSGK